MGTTILDVIAPSGFFWFGGLHPAWQTNPILKHKAGRIGIALLVISLILGWGYYQQRLEDEKVDREKWDIARDINTTESYCTYLQQYPNGIYAKEANELCHSHQSLPVQPVATAPAEETKPAPVEEWQTIDRYQVKGGLVKDTQTGLMWMRCSLGQVWDDSTCQGDVAKYTWDGTMQQNSSSYAGYSDWRVPTIQELKSLVYCSSGQPKTWASDVYPMDNICKGDYAKPTIKNDVFISTPSDAFWSSSTHPNDNRIPLVVNFAQGYDAMSDRGSSYAVRLVRSGQ